MHGSQGPIDFDEGCDEVLDDMACPSTGMQVATAGAPAQHAFWQHGTLALCRFTQSGTRSGGASTHPWHPSCACAHSAAARAPAATALALMSLYAAYWLWTVRRAIKDHALLPWHKYR